MAAQDQATHLLQNVLTTDNPADHRLWLVEAALICPWLNLDTGVALSLIRRYWRVGLAEGHAAVWNGILQQYAAVGDNSLELQLVRVVCLRRTGSIDRAAELIERLLADTGRTGAFALQAETLLEHAALWRMRGQYHMALEILQKVEALPAVYRVPLRQRVMLEYAQIAIDSEDARLAERYIGKLDETPASHLLLMELNYLTHRFEACRAMGEVITGIGQAALLDRAAVHTIIGRSYQAENRLPAAIFQFENAVNLFDRAGDMFALARAQTNLAALLIETGASDRAESLLEAAQNTQTRLHDTVGLDATRVNRQYLRRQRLS